MHAGIQPGGQRGVLDDLDRSGDLLGAGLGDVVLAQIGVLVHVQLGVGRIIDGEACIGAGQAVLVVIQPSISSFSETRRPMVFLMTVKMMNIVASTQAATLTMPSSWMPSLAKPPP